MTPESRRIPDALLDRYLSGALDPEAKRQLEATLAQSPWDKARLAELRADSAAFLLQHPPAPFVARVQKAERPAWWRSWPVLLAPALATAMLTLLVFQPQIEQLLQTLIEGDPYTVKGSVMLVLHRKVGESSVQVSSGDTLSPGDAIRFEAKASNNGFLAVVGRDAKGVITVYHPFGGTAAHPYEASQPLLPEAVALDDTLGREDVYALFSQQAFELDWAVRALEEGRSLPQAAPKGISVGHTFFVKK
ncbi:hypothetical protein [Hyalangium rubrum]|uniref:ActD-like protein n=1 Tax=Hyalangium rubrum TaxID=3103134 RepID=A0ABU5GZ71_9BACT|nr:hypothetical protein [Hyalangium sp. s54d21]MDY7226475.1 hypothetical protein [Hyalangium sp. s54d21]